MKFKQEGPGNRFLWPADKEAWFVLIISFLFWLWIIHSIFNYLTK